MNATQIKNTRARLSTNNTIATRQLLDSLPSSMALESKMIIVRKVIG